MAERTLDLERGSARHARGRTLDRWARTAVCAQLRRLERGAITLVDGEDCERFGAPETELEATVHVLDPRFYRALLLGSGLGAAEAYMDGMWRCDDLTALIRIMALNYATLERLERGPARLFRPALRLLHALRSNTRPGARRNIAAHYDLGNDFFELFLDPTLTYSCGIFERPEATLQEASVAKYDRICRKLELGPDDHVLEIGSGWGGFAIHAAATYGCRVTTTTISQEQHALARERVEAAGLADRVEILFDDYRDLQGKYDKLVSIEMIEAVGHRHLDAFFRACGERLRPHGAMLLQAITVWDRDYVGSIRSVDFIKRYIFPGGQLVSLGAVGDAVARVTDLRIAHLEDIGPHYAETLRRWRVRMFQNLERMRALGLPDRFLRMWEFYLCYCEGSFRERAISVVQLFLEKPMTRRTPLLGDLL